MSALRRISLAVLLSFPPSCSGLLKVHFKRPVSGTPNITPALFALLAVGKVCRRRRFLFLCATMSEAGKDGASTRDVADEGSRFDPVQNCLTVQDWDQESVSVTMLNLQPCRNRRQFLKAHTTARHSNSMTAYRLSASERERLPHSNRRHCPSGCCCQRAYSRPCTQMHSFPITTDHQDQNVQSLVARPRRL